MMLNSLEIEKGLQSFKEKDSDGTIGMAIQEIMGLGVFTRDAYAIRVCKPIDSVYSIDDVWKVVHHIQYLVSEGKIIVIEKDENYGIIKGGELMRIRGHHFESIALPPIPSSNQDETWLTLSSKYIINK